MVIGEGRRRGQNDFSLRMNSSLSKRWMCCAVENLSKVFLSEQPLIFLWVMRVYIAWVKGKKVTLKILQAKCFMGTLQDGLSCEAFTKCSCHLTLQFPAYASHVPFLRVTLLANFLRASGETTLILQFMLNFSPT